MHLIAPIFQSVPGGACPQTPLPIFATYGARDHTFCALNTTLKLVATVLSIDWNYFRCVKVYQVYNDNAEIILI